MKTEKKKGKSFNPENPTTYGWDVKFWSAKKVCRHGLSDIKEDVLFNFGVQKNSAGIVCLLLSDGLGTWTPFLFISVVCVHFLSF